MKQKTNKILNFLHEQRRYDFTGNRLSMIERRITKRLFSTKSNNFEEYFEYLLIHPEEFNELFVNREFRIKELKDKVKELEKNSP